MQWISKTTLHICLYFISATLGRYLKDTLSSNRQLDLNSVEDYKSYIKDKVLSRHPKTLDHNMSFYNLTIAEQRKKLKQYRAKLLELQELDEQAVNSGEIHVRQFHSYAMKEIKGREGKFKFEVNIPHPESYKSEIKVQSAMLRLRRKAVSRDQLSQKMNVEFNQRNVGYNTILLFYQTLPGNMRRLVTSEVISLLNNSTLSIDLTSVVQAWIEEPNINYGIEIECVSHNINTIVELPSKSDGIHLSTLDIYTYEHKINIARRKRSVDEDLCEPDQNKCCRRPIEIKFSEVGLHVPGIHSENETFTAYMCDGRCSRKHRLHNKWAEIKDTLRDNGNRGVRNRCVPTEFESNFRHFNFDEDGVIAFTEYDDIIVKQCGCA